jgi:SPX domain protein involved in polyphosphate accumulation
MTDNNLTFRRKERKFLVVEHSFDELVEALSDHIPVNIYHGNSPCCRIQTIYLDTVDHALYHEYLLRREFRFKIRLRRYGYDGEFQEYYLVEIKAKNNGISNKKRFILPGECLQDFLSGADIKKQIKAANKGLKGAQKTYKLVRKLIALNSLVPVMEKVKALSSTFETVNTYSRIVIDFVDPANAMKVITPGERLFVRIQF